MGVVYEGFDPNLGRRVAIKTILQNAAFDADVARDFAMRFTREAKAAARLSHPNIVQVYDFGVEDELSYLVMEFVQGTELSAYFERNEVFDIQDTTRLMTQLLDALELAHNAGIVHRDIKPANVMVDSEGRAKLADFGVARVSDGQDATQVGAMVGTPAYMSPEQVQGHAVDRRTDIFSAGVILYQFLTGQKPFQGGGAYTLARKIIHDEPATPSSLAASVSPEYDRVIARALAKNPDERYQSAREFSEALNRALKGEQAQADDADSTRKISAADLPRAEEPARAQPETMSTDVELEFWRSTKDSDEIDDLELYLGKFPQGVYAELAQRKVAKLKRAAHEASEARRLAAEKDAQARREAEEQARLEAQAQRAAQLKREAEAEAAARTKANEAAQRAAAAAAPPKAVAAPATPAPSIPRPELMAQTEPPKKSSMAIPAIIGVLVVGAAAAGYFGMRPNAPIEASAPAAPAAVPAPPPAPARASAPESAPPKAELKPEVALPAAPVAPAPAPVAEKPRIEKAPPAASATVKAPPARSATDSASARAAAEIAAARAAAEEAAATAAAEQRAAAAEAAAAKAATERAAAEQRASTAEGAAKAAADRAAAEKAAAPKAAADKAVAEKAAADKLAADKARDSAKAAPYQSGFMSGVRNWSSNPGTPASNTDTGQTTAAPAPAAAKAPAGKPAEEPCTYQRKFRNLC